MKFTQWLIDEADRRKRWSARCARCRHTERLHMWSMSDKPKSTKWTSRWCWARVGL